MGLADHLRVELPSPVSVHDKSRGGATLESLFTAIQIMTVKNPTCNMVVLLVGGICNLTRIEKTEHGRQVMFNISESDIKIQNIKTQIEAIANFCSDHHHKLIIGTITPADLINAREHYITTKKLRRPTTEEEEQHIITSLTHQQSALEDAISVINHFISDHQDIFHYNIVNQHRDLDNKSIKKRGKNGKNKGKTAKFNANNLTDGVHLVDIIQFTIFSKFVTASKRLIF